MPKLKDSIIIDPQHKGKPSFFAFDIFITPVLIQILFVVACINSIWIGASFCLATWNGGCEIESWNVIIQWLGVYGYVVGVGISIIGILVARVLCELGIVIFKIFLELRKSQ